MCISNLRRNSSARCAVNQPFHQKIRFINILDRTGILSDRRCQRVQSDRTAAKLFDDRHENVSIHPIQTERIHIHQVEGGVRHRFRNHAVIFDLRKIAHPLQNPVCQTRRPAASARKLRRPRILDFYVQNLCRLLDNQLQLILRPNSQGGLGLSPQEYGFANGTVGMVGLLLGGIMGGILVSSDGMEKWLQF